MNNKDSDIETSKPCHFVVGIGASAGGLSPLREIFEALPNKPEMAFIIVQHLPVDNEPLLTEILGELSSIPVLDARDGMLVECNGVYIAPPQTIVTVDGHHLTVRPVENAEERRRTIDPMLRSLARSHGSRAVGVILSGNNADGTAGLLAITEEGGLAIAQSLETAQFEMMPRSAIESGVVDRELKPAEIPSRLRTYYNDLVKMEQADRETEEQSILSRLDDISPRVRAVTGHDFSHYKTSTLVRRIQRRMRVLHITEVDAYVEVLASKTEEARALFREILIGVTSFFRDGDAFDVLADQALSQIIEGRGPRESIRIWVPGCSSGEEAYTIAILVLEKLDGVRPQARPKIQIFGTDIDEEALQDARRGSYSPAIEAGVSPERLKRFFITEDDRYTVKKELRDICLFAEHNIIRDPPFVDLDLVSCRNLLIYLDPELQGQVLLLFHHSLRAEGFLFLGSSETVSPYAEIFRSRDKKARLWQNTSSTGSPRPTLPMDSGKVKRSQSTIRGNRQPDSRVHDQFQRILAEEYAPRAVVVRRDGRIVYASNGLEKFLEIPRGQFHNNLVKMVSSGLRMGVRAGLKQAVETGESVVNEGLTFKAPSGTQPARVIVRPMFDDDESNAFYMVVFEEVGPSIEEAHQHLDGADQAEAIIVQLEHELESTRTSLEQTVQDAETTNEELKSSNEELRSMNEEFQSANEELEASREEIAASNETLAKAKADIENLLYSAQLATLFLDDDLTIKMFTPAATEIYKLRSTDVGRPLDEINHRVLEMPPLPEVEELGARNEPVIDEVRTDDGRWYIRRVLPYLTGEGEHRGMVLTFTDVTDLKGVTESLQRRTAELEAAREQAELATGAKSEFLANTSHEIRTPMTCILGFADLLLESLEDKKDRSSVETIKKNALFLLDIINEILDLTKIEEGKFEVENRRFDPRDLMQEVTDLMQVRAHEKSLPLTIEYDADVPSLVETDPTRLRQILLNLVENALKFTSEGYVAVKVGFVHGEEPRLQMKIVDTGIGMTEREQEKMFEPFVQADTSLTRKYGGTGLGLTITRRLIDLLGGTIDVESERGEGTTFVVEIPVRLPAEEEAVGAEPAEEDEKAVKVPVSSADGKKPRVLVVDDYEEICRLFSLFLTNAGADVETASNGREALERIDVAERAGAPFDVVIMDMQMPELDGYEATRALRRSGFEAPIIALTAAAMEGNDKVCFAAGCTDYMSKPVRPGDLVDLVGKYTTLAGKGAS
ncbi:MAG: CheR family methyltransferase [Bradymonadaceae bacterium]